VGGTDAGRIAISGSGVPSAVVSVVCGYIQTPTAFHDIHHASRHREIFSSIPTSTSLNEVSPEIAEFAGSMINLDDPRHLRLRKIVNRAFTPKVVARIEDSVRDRARRIVTDLIANHRDAQADFVVF
jgi:cytochrome P450